MGLPPNPLNDFPPQPEYVPVTRPAPVIPKSEEDPPWTGWDVLFIVAVTVGASFVLELAVIFGAEALAYGRTSWASLARKPELLLLTQLLGQGKVDVRAVFAALEEVKFRGWAVVELDRVPVAGRTPLESAMMSRRFLDGL